MMRVTIIISHQKAILVGCGNCQLNRNHAPKNICTYSSQPFQQQKRLLDEHLARWCFAIEGQQTKLPDQGSELQLEKYNTHLECPFVILLSVVILNV